MNDLERRQIESLIRVDNFGKENAADFPANSVGSGAFAIIAQAVTQLTALGAIRSGASDDKFSATSRRKMAREELYADLMTISQTARVMALDSENFIDKFRLPRGNRNDRTMLETARAFAAQLVPLVSDFTAYGLPANFLTDLNGDIEAFEQATNNQDGASQQRIGANAEIDEIIENALLAKRRLDVIVPNVYRNNAGKLAAWSSAAHIERAPKSPTAPPSQPQVTPVA